MARHRHTRPGTLSPDDAGYLRLRQAAGPELWGRKRRVTLEPRSCLSLSPVRRPRDNRARSCLNLSPVQCPGQQSEELPQPQPSAASSEQQRPRGCRVSPHLSLQCISLALGPATFLRGTHRCGGLPSTPGESPLPGPTFSPQQRGQAPLMRSVSPGSRVPGELPSHPPGRSLRHEVALSPTAVGFCLHGAPAMGVPWHRGQPGFSSRGHQG